MVSNIKNETLTMDDSLIEMLIFEQNIAESFTRLEIQLTEKKFATLTKMAALICNYKQYINTPSGIIDTETELNTNNETPRVLQPEETKFEINSITNNLKSYANNVLSAINEIDGLFDLLVIPSNNRGNESLFNTQIKESAHYELIDHQYSSIYDNGEDNKDIFDTHSVLNTTKTIQKTSMNAVSLLKQSEFCNVCGKYVSCIQTHKKTHTEPYLCMFCGKEFGGKRLLIQHVRIHTGEKPYSCELCGEAFSQNCNLKRHIRIHTGENPYSCVLCGKAFAQNGNLTKHLRIHTGEKPYACKLCYRAFSEKCSLTKHIRIHTKEKPYSCELCCWTFSSTASLKRHAKTHVC